MDPVNRGILLSCDRRVQSSLSRPHRLDRIPLDPLQLERDRQARQGILRLVPPAASRNARRLHGARFPALLRILGTGARPDVFHHRHLGRPAPRLCVDEVRHLHIDRLRAHVSRHPNALLPELSPDQLALIQHRCANEDQSVRNNAVVGILGFLPRLCREGADVPVPHLAA